MRSTYDKNDVSILLKDVTGMLQPLDTAEREKQIQKGVHYSEMLPLEYRPTAAYLQLYHEALNQHSILTASALKTVAEKIYAYKKGKIVLVSLARAGTPVGILLRRYFKRNYNIDIPHYSISIIRGRGIDSNAMKHILSRHNPAEIQFVDGWIGKGAIIKELRSEMLQYRNIDSELAVLADPSRLTSLYGTTEDFLIPSACLNATVSGLFSRTILNSSIIGPDDFHGAVYFAELEQEDVSNSFLDCIMNALDRSVLLSLESERNEINNEAEQIKERCGVKDINFVKPGIGETTRVLLRRVPWKVLVRDLQDERYIGHIKRLCVEKNVQIEEYPLKQYRACGIIKNLQADI